MKLVVDTNVLIAGSLWQGPSARLLSAALEGRAQIFLSLSLLLEFREVLDRPQFVKRLGNTGETAETIVTRFRSSCFEAVPAELLPPASLRDRDDLHVLACAVGGGVDAIVSGDKDLLAIKSFEGIPIISPTDALARLGLS